MKNLSYEKILRMVDDKGYIEILSGVYINSRESITDDQKQWHEEDGNKNFDFSPYKYWITTDQGEIELGFDFVEQLVEWLGAKNGNL